MKEFDVDKRTYHEAQGRIWRVESGKDFAGLRNLEVFQKHAEKYIPEEKHDERINRDKADDRDLEVLDVDFEDRGFRIFKESGENYTFLFYREVEGEVEDKAEYIDEIWEREIDTILTETARSKTKQRHRLKNSEDEYDNRLAGNI